MNEKTAILFQLGPVTDRGQWHDYLQYGFGTANVPELLNLVSDESLHLSVIFTAHFLSAGTTNTTPNI